MKEKFPDPYEMFFGSMLLSDINRQFDSFHMLNAQWFSIKQHKYLYECLKHHVENGIEMSIITAAEWFKARGMLGEDMNVLYLSRLSQRIGYLSNGDIQACVSEMSRLYFQQLTFGFHSRISRSITPETFNIDKIREEVDKFQQQLDESYVEEVELTNEDLVDQVIESHDKAKEGDFQGISIGFNSLNHVLLEFVDFMVIGARPSMGKTAFVMSSIYNLIFLRKKRIVFYSLEMSKIQIMRRLISIGTGIPDERIKLGMCTDEEKARIEEFKRRPELSLLVIYEGSHKATDIIRKTSVLNKKQPIDLVMVDYLQKIAPPRQGMKMLEITSDASNQMKNLSMNLNIPTVALAQLSRSVEQRGGDKRPVLSDLRESGEIEQDATIVAFLHRPEYYGIMVDESGESLQGIGEFILAKNRGGKIGSTKMKFEGELMKWSDYTNHIPMNTMPVNNKFDTPEKNSEKSNDLPF